MKKEGRQKKKKNVDFRSLNNTVLQGGDKFRIETHNIIIKKFCSELDKRIEAYKFVSDNFYLLQSC